MSNFSKSMFGWAGHRGEDEIEKNGKIIETFPNKMTA